MKLAPENTGVIYARYSSNNQREESLDAQIRACTDYAKSKGIEIVGIYTDAAKTGTNANREEFLKMIEDSGKGIFRYLIIHKLDRFSRDKFDAVTFKRKLRINGVTILSVWENLDDSPESAMMESVLEGMMAVYHSQNLAREVKKGMHESALKCTHLGGVAPLGYDVDPQSKKYIINEAEAAIVRTIFEKYASGVGYNQILDYLNGNGFKSKRGNTFGKNSLHSILNNEKYVGRFIFNKMLEKDITGKRSPQARPRDEWVIVENGLPAIVDADTFNVVQAKLNHNLKNGGSFKSKEVYLLSGIVKCGECGYKMIGNTRFGGRNKTKYSSYRCSNRTQHKGCSNKELRKEYLDNYVLDQLYNKLFSDTSIRKLSAMLSEYNRRKVENSDSKLSRVKAEIVKVTEQISKVIRLVSESGVSIDTVKDELKRLEERKHYLEDYLQEITLASKAAAISEEMITDLIGRSQEFVKSKNIPECRNFIQNYIDRVVIHNEHVEVFFKINVPDDSSDTVSPLKSAEGIKELRKEYRAS